MKFDFNRTYPKEMGSTQQCAQYVLLKWLNSQPNSSFDKKFQGPHSSGTGVSDFIGSWQGFAVYIEVKSATGTPSPKQTEFIRKKKAAGARAGFARTINDCFEICNGGFGAEFPGEWDNEDS